MTGNPLSPMVPYLASAAKAEAQPDQLRWAVVASVTPPQVSYVADVEDTPLQVVSLVPADQLKVGAPALVHHGGTAPVLVGVTDWPAPPPPPGPPQWQTVTLQNGWVNYTTFGGFGFRREGDLVRLRGTIRNGTPGADTPFAVLPVDCRPTVTRLLPGACGSTQVDVRVNSSGELYVNSSSVSLPWLALESITYSL